INSSPRTADTDRNGTAKSAPKPLRGTCHERKSLLENRRQDERASAGDRLGASVPTWSFMTKRTVNIRMVFAPSDGASASCSGDSARYEASLSKSSSLAMGALISTESLILAQDERWRRA